MNISDIRENLMVHAKGEGSMGGARGVHIGTVDHLDRGNLIKLNRKDSQDGKHHWIPVDWVDSVDDKCVYLKKTKEEVLREWKTQGPMQ